MDGVSTAQAMRALDVYTAMTKNGDALPARLVAMKTALEAALAMPAPTVSKYPPARCYAQQCGDEMLCGRCGLTWDVGDPEPPACSPVERRITIRRGEDRA